MLIFLLICCKKNNKGPYYNSDHDFSIQFPQGWIVKENEKDTTVMAVMPQYSKNEFFNENINIVVNKIERTLSLEEYNREQVEGIKRIKNLKVLDEGKIVIDHCEGRWFIYSYVVNNFGIKARVYSMIKDNKSYLITCIFEKSNYEKYESLFQATVLTFRLSPEK